MSRSRRPPKQDTRDLVGRGPCSYWPHTSDNKRIARRRRRNRAAREVSDVCTCTDAENPGGLAHDMSPPRCVVCGRVREG